MSQDMTQWENSQTQFVECITDANDDLEGSSSCSNDVSSLCFVIMKWLSVIDAGGNFITVIFVLRPVNQCWETQFWICEHLILYQMENLLPKHQVPLTTLWSCKTKIMALWSRKIRQTQPVLQYPRINGARSKQTSLLHWNSCLQIPNIPFHTTSCQTWEFTKQEYEIIRLKQNLTNSLI